MKGEEWIGMPSRAAVSWATCRGSLRQRDEEHGKRKSYGRGGGGRKDGGSEGGSSRYEGVRTLRGEGEENH